MVSQRKGEGTQEIASDEDEKLANLIVIFFRRWCFQGVNIIVQENS